VEKSAYADAPFLSDENDPRRKKVEEYLKNENRSALALYKALFSLYGREFLEWEPETLWLTLEKDGVSLEIEARNKIQAARTLKTTPASLWDNSVFQHLTQALNDIPFDPDALQECDPAHMAWTVIESQEILSAGEGADDDDFKESPEYDEDVQAYVAVCIQRDGMVCLPDPLLFAQDALDNISPEGAKKLAVEVRRIWDQVKDFVNLHDVEFAETPEQVQLAKLAACRLYTNRREEDMRRDVGQLLDVFI
jgi:hypothetical protein